MNGARAEPSAKTINAPSKTKITINGQSQNFFSFLKKANSSFKMSILFELKLIFH